MAPKRTYAYAYAYADDSDLLLIKEAAPPPDTARTPSPPEASGTFGPHGRQVAATPASGSFPPAADR
ncbi:hypothetical protein ACFXAE_26350 [Streptomyces sp. NPDC059454]|uniref:hypothetical protein n=1 Tax=Streptomyces sp. NPDC059454 TaxID=3346836 RepID=UPI0036C97458